jgi:hypothetical protein
MEIKTIGDAYLAVSGGTASSGQGLPRSTLAAT